MTITFNPPTVYIADGFARMARPTQRLKVIRIIVVRVSINVIDLVRYLPTPTL